MQYITSDRQTLLDVAIITLGAVDAVFSLALRNKLSITAPLPDGTPISFEPDDLIDPAVQSAYAARRIIPATEIPRADYLELLYQTGSPRPDPDIPISPDLDKIDQMIDSFDRGMLILPDIPDTTT